MSLTKDLSRVRQKILLSVVGDDMDFEKLSEDTEVVGPELNYHLVRLRSFGLVAYRENGSTVSLTEKGKQVVSELRASLAATSPA
jgi:predicted transcriptional regulator